MAIGVFQWNAAQRNMAAARNFLFSRILRNTQLLAKWHCTQKPLTAAVRHSSYLSSQPVQPLEEYPEVEVLHNPPEWKYVERLLPKPIVPKPAEKSEYPSGWKPPTAVGAENLKYFVARTKNHMVPVYLHTRYRGQRRITVVRRIQGDIWTLEQELRAVVEQARDGKVCATRVNEMSGQIHIYGDYVDVVREYLKERGY